MADIVVTVPRDRFAEWVQEGDWPGQPWTGLISAFTLYHSTRPPISPGERVYIVACGKLRGYAPLVELEMDPPHWNLLRRGGAVAVTLPGSITGFRGWRERWWDRADEVPFPDWRTL